MSLEKCYHANFITENHLSKGLIVVIMKECGLSLGGTSETQLHDEMLTIGLLGHCILWPNLYYMSTLSEQKKSTLSEQKKSAKSIYASGRRTVVLIECVLFSAKWEICWLYHGENKSGVDPGFQVRERHT